MIFLLTLTLAVIIIYLLYPAALRILPEFRPVYTNNELTQPVTIILLSYNGYPFLVNKIRQIAAELHTIPGSELIVIDDLSTDGSVDLLNKLQNEYQFNLILKNKHLGIPHSIKLSIRIANHPILVFCDQRQTFHVSWLKSLVAPLEDPRIGAVSCSISHATHHEHGSLLRHHENYIKKCESRVGYVIGLYGPLYAIRKSSCQELDDRTILDDLCLSLLVLQNKRIIMAEGCRVTEESFGQYYTFSRTKRYLAGLAQLIFCRRLAGKITFQNQVLLFWHKYLRLFIPPLVLASVITIAFRFSAKPLIIILPLFCVPILLAVIPFRKGWLGNLNDLIRISIFYPVSMILYPLTKMSNIVRCFRNKQQPVEP